MPDIFDQVAESPAAPNPQPQGDIFDQIADKQPAPAQAPSSGPQDGFWNRAKNVAAGPNTFLGNVLPSPEPIGQPQQPQQSPVKSWYKGILPRAGLDLMIPGLGSMAPERAIDKPLVDVNAARIEDIPGVTAGALDAIHPGLGSVPQANQAARGAIKGAESFASGVTKPENIALLAGTGGLGAAGSGAGAVAKVAPLLGRLASLGFSYSMLHDAYEQIPVFREQVEKGDIEGAAQTATSIVANAGMGALAGAHGAADLIRAEPMERYQQRQSNVPPSQRDVGAGGTRGPAEPEVLPTQGGIAQEQPAAPPPTHTDHIGPRTPNPPTAAKPTVPETPETLNLQLQQMAEGKRKVVMVPKANEGFEPAAPLPQGISVTADASGNRYYFDTQQGVTASQVRTAAKTNRLPEILGGPEGMMAPDKSALPPDAPTVVVRAPDGTEVQATATSPEVLPATVAAHEPLVPEGGSISVEGAAGVLQGRQTPSQEVIQPQAPAEAGVSSSEPSLPGGEQPPLQNPPPIGSSVEDFYARRRARETASAIPNPPPIGGTTEPIEPALTPKERAAEASRRELAAMRAAPPAEPTPAPTHVRKPTAVQRNKALVEERRKIYTPGNVIRSQDGGLDKVLDYQEKPDGTFKVTVQAVTPEGGIDPFAPKPRTHATPPDANTRIVSQDKTEGPVSSFVRSEEGSFNPQFLKDSLQEARVLKEKRDKALAELEKAKTTPAQKNWGQHVRQYFTGERDFWGARANQEIHLLRKTVPDHVDQEALSLMRDFKNKPLELQAWANGTHPNYPTTPEGVKNIERIKPAIDRALNPSPEMKQADMMLDMIAEVSLLEGKKLGFLESSLTPEEYVSHLLHPKGEGETATPFSERASSMMGGKMSRRFAHAQKRNYPTLLDAIADNVKPKTLNALDAFTIYSDKFATTRATHLLVKQLKDSGIGKWSNGGNVPADWVEIAPHAHPFRNTIAYEDKAGNPTVGHQTLMVPKFIEEALRPITDPDFTPRIPGFAKVQAYQSAIKAAQLGMSLFHLVTENYMALASMGIRGRIMAARANMDDAKFLAPERNFIALGMTSPIQGKTVEAYHALQPGSIPTWGDIWRKLPAIKQMDHAAEAITKYTFDDQMRKYKVTDMQMKEAAWRAKHPNATDSEYVDAMHDYTKVINATYGGLHWENLGINRMAVQIARALMLAPDWTYSNVMSARYAFQKGTAGRASRMFWVKAVVGGLAATQMLSVMLTGQHSKRPTQVYMGKDKDGKEIYENVFFKGAPGDVANLITNVRDYGAVGGLGRSMMGKANSLIRTAIQIGSNEDYLHRPIVPKGMNPVAATGRVAAHAVKGMAPIPWSYTNVYDMLAGPNAEKYTSPEIFAMLAAGSPPIHVVPEGMRDTKKGIVPDTRKKGAELSTMQQLWTGAATFRDVKDLNSAMKIYAEATPEQQRQMNRDMRAKLAAARFKPDKWNAETKRLAMEHFRMQPNRSR